MTVGPSEYVCMHLLFMPLGLLLRLGTQIEHMYHEDDDDDDVFIKLPDLPSRGMLCGYKTGHLLLWPALVFYLMWIWLCGEDNLRLICPGLPQIKESAARFFRFGCTYYTGFLPAIDRPVSPVFL